MEARLTFGEMLRAQRKTAKRTLADVAGVLDKSVSYIADIEHGRRSPLSSTEIEKVCKAIGGDPLEFAKAAAVSRGAVSVASQEPERLEIAAQFARTLEHGDADSLARLRAFFDEELRGKK